MKSLNEMVYIDDNNDDFISLLVKEDQEKDLMHLGFDGDEASIIITKGIDNDITLIKHDGSKVSWEYNKAVNLIPLDRLLMQTAIVECVEDYMDIVIESRSHKDLTEIHKYYGITCPTIPEDREHIIDITVDKEDNDIISGYIKKDDSPFMLRKFRTCKELMKHFKRFGWNVEFVRTGIATNSKNLVHKYYRITR